MDNSRIYRTTPAQYVRQAIGVWLSARWWMFALPLFCLLIAGLYDWRWWIAAMAICLLVYPALLMIVYFSHVLRPEAAYSTIPHSVDIDSTSIVVTYHPEEGCRCPASRTFLPDDIAHIEDCGKTIIITMHSSKYDYLIIPASVLSPTELSRLRVWSDNLMSQEP